MSSFQTLRPAVRAYVTGVVLIGACLIVRSAQVLLAKPTQSDWLLIAGLTVLTGSFSVKVPKITAYISVSEAFVFASVLLFGPEAGTITVLLECLVILLWMSPQGRPVYRVLFNLAAPSAAIWLAGHAFYAASGLQPYSVSFTPLPQLFGPLVGFTIAYFLLNSWLVAIAVGLETASSPFNIWLSNFAWLSVNYFSGASVAALIVTYAQHLDFSTLAVIVPLLVVSYLTFRTAMGRAEDSYNHLSQLNRLYLSTIETLAMAIDAKDQITHGHIRRVQAYAVGLARHVGVTDDSLLKAIEAAALLHDMGKLAIPEHILNKPGKLTPAEFEKMKLHAGIGADILSAIDFPYPVVPIVRHHHENWDGSGYPDGLSGTTIPIGARILSVVDCFDALTSDRPYRTKLTDQQALDILLERRGKMYDPLVVDTFQRVHKEIAPDQPLDAHAQPITALGSLQTNELAITPSVAAKTDGFKSGSRSAALPNPVVVDEWLAHASSLLRANAVLFRYKSDVDVLIVSAATSVFANMRAGATLAMGERLSGWVASTRNAIVNSDAALDLGDPARAAVPPMEFALSVPVEYGDDLLGVLSFYSSTQFSEDDLESARRLARSATSELFQIDAVSPTKLPQRADAVPPVAPVTSMVYVDFLNGPQLQAILGQMRWSEIRHAMCERMRELLTPGDVIIRSRENEVLMLLARTEAKDVRIMSRRIRAEVESTNKALNLSQPVAVAIDSFLAPSDSVSVFDALSEDRSISEFTSAKIPAQVH